MPHVQGNRLQYVLLAGHDKQVGELIVKHSHRTARA